MSENQEKKTITSGDLATSNDLNKSQKNVWIANSIVVLGLFILLVGTVLFSKAYITHIPFTIVTLDRQDKNNQLLNYFASLAFIMSIAIILLIIPYINRFFLIENKKIKIVVLVISIWLMFCSIFLYYCEYKLQGDWWEYYATITLGGYFVVGAISDFISTKFKYCFFFLSLMLFFLFIVFSALSGSFLKSINI